MNRHAPKLALAAVAAALLLGCAPLPERDDPIAETRRMAEEARRSMRASGSGNILVTVERTRAGQDDAGGLAAMWRYAAGRLSVSGGDGLAGGGVRLGSAGESFEARLAAWRSTARSSTRESAEISVQSGYQGTLWIGRDVLVPVLRIVTSAGAVVEHRNVRVGTCLKVVPRALEDGRIELALSPYFAARDGEDISVEQMSTRVVLEPGQKLVLGSNSSASADSVAAGLFGYDSRGRQVITLLTVSAERM